MIFHFFKVTIFGATVTASHFYLHTAAKASFAFMYKTYCYSYSIADYCLNQIIFKYIHM